MFSMPILAKIAVIAAKIADSTAHICQEANIVIARRSPCLLCALKLRVNC
jgi:hypothetical protein